MSDSSLPNRPLPRQKPRKSTARHPLRTYASPPGSGSDGNRSAYASDAASSSSSPSSSSTYQSTATNNSTALAGHIQRPTGGSGGGGGGRAYGALSGQFAVGAGASTAPRPVYAFRQDGLPRQGGYGAAAAATATATQRVLPSPSRIQSSAGPRYQQQQQQQQRSPTTPTKGLGIPSLPRPLGTSSPNARQPFRKRGSPSAYYPHGRQDQSSPSALSASTLPFRRPVPFDRSAFLLADQNQDQGQDHAGADADADNNKRVFGPAKALHTIRPNWQNQDELYVLREAGTNRELGVKQNRGGRRRQQQHVDGGSAEDEVIEENRANRAIAAIDTVRRVGASTGSGGGGGGGGGGRQQQPPAQARPSPPEAVMLPVLKLKVSEKTLFQLSSTEAELQERARTTFRDLTGRTGALGRGRGAIGVEAQRTISGTDSEGSTSPTVRLQIGRKSAALRGRGGRMPRRHLATRSAARKTGIVAGGDDDGEGSDSSDSSDSSSGRSTEESSGDESEEAEGRHNEYLKRKRLGSGSSSNDDSDDDGEGEEETPKKIGIPQAGHRLHLAAPLAPSYSRSSTPGLDYVTPTPEGQPVVGPPLLSPSSFSQETRGHDGLPLGRADHLHNTDHQHHQVGFHGAQENAPSAELLAAYEMFLLPTVRMRQTKRLPFLMRNLRKGFELWCSAKGIPTVATSTSRGKAVNLAKKTTSRAPPKPLSLPPPPPPSKSKISVLVRYVFYLNGMLSQVYETRMDRWKCPLCDLFGKKGFGTREMLRVHLKRAHCERGEFVCRWEPGEEAGSYSLIVQLTDSAVDEERQRREAEGNQMPISTVQPAHGPQSSISTPDQRLAMDIDDTEPVLATRASKVVPANSRDATSPPITVTTPSSESISSTTRETTQTLSTGSSMSRETSITTTTRTITSDFTNSTSGSLTSQDDNFPIKLSKDEADSPQHFTPSWSFPSFPPHTRRLHDPSAFPPQPFFSPLLQLPIPPPTANRLGPALQPPNYILPFASLYGGPTVPYSFRIGGPYLFDLLNSLPMHEYGVLAWTVLDREEEIWESGIGDNEEDDEEGGWNKGQEGGKDEGGHHVDKAESLRDEEKVMQALWARWILLNRAKFIMNYEKGTKEFITFYWKMIHLACGWVVLRNWLVMLMGNRFLSGKQVARLLKHYESLVKWDTWYE